MPPPLQLTCQWWNTERQKACPCGVYAGQPQNQTNQWPEWRLWLCRGGAWDGCVLGHMTSLPCQHNVDGGHTIGWSLHLHKIVGLHQARSAYSVCMCVCVCKGPGVMFVSDRIHFTVWIVNACNLTHKQLSHSKQSRLPIIRASACVYITKLLPEECIHTLLVLPTSWVSVCSDTVPRGNYAGNSIINRTLGGL